MTRTTAPRPSRPSLAPPGTTGGGATFAAGAALAMTAAATGGGLGVVPEAALAAVLAAYAALALRAWAEAGRSWPASPAAEALAARGKAAPPGAARWAREAWAQHQTTVLRARVKARLLRLPYAAPAEPDWAAVAEAAAARAADALAERAARALAREYERYLDAQHATTQMRAYTTRRRNPDGTWAVEQHTGEVRVLTVTARTAALMARDGEYTAAIAPRRATDAAASLGRAAVAALRDGDLAQELAAAAGLGRLAEWGLEATLQPQGAALVIRVRWADDAAASTAAAADAREPAPEPESPEPEALRPDGPRLTVLQPHRRLPGGQLQGAMAKQALERALTAGGGRGAEVRVLSVGPTAVQLRVVPPPGIPASRIIANSDNLRAHGGAPLRGLRLYVDDERGGLIAEVTRREREVVTLREMWAALGRDERAMERYAQPFGVGVGADGRPVLADLAATPHMQISGTTGSGKSVFAHALLLTLIAARTPQQVRLALIDPKGGVELAPYRNIPHLWSPIATDAAFAADMIRGLVDEMEQRNRVFAQYALRDVDSYNRRYPNEQLPRLVLYVDEAADLLMGAEQEQGREARQQVEMALTRIAQKARSAGIHLVLATQKPVVSTIPTLLRGNLPTKLAFTVTTQAESMVALDEPGAETLSGKGDALWKAVGTKPVRVQTPLVTEAEIEAVLDAVRGGGDEAGARAAPAPTSPLAALLGEGDAPAAPPNPAPDDPAAPPAQAADPATLARARAAMARALADGGDPALAVCRACQCSRDEAAALIRQILEME